MVEVVTTWISLVGHHSEKRELSSWDLNGFDLPFGSEYLHFRIRRESFELANHFPYVLQVGGTCTWYTVDLSKPCKVHRKTISSISPHVACLAIAVSIHKGYIQWKPLYFSYQTIFCTLEFILLPGLRLTRIHFLSEVLKFASP